MGWKSGIGRAINKVEDYILASLFIAPVAAAIYINRPIYTPKTEQVVIEIEEVTHRLWYNYSPLSGSEISVVPERSTSSTLLTPPTDVVELHAVPVDWQVGDFDNDGKQDITLTYYKKGAKPSPEAKHKWTEAFSGEVHREYELLISEEAKLEFWLAKGNGDGTFQEEQLVPGFYPRPWHPETVNQELLPGKTEGEDENSCNEGREREVFTFTDSYFGGPQIRAMTYPEYQASDPTPRVFMFDHTPLSMKISIEETAYKYELENTPTVLNLHDVPIKWRLTDYDRDGLADIVLTYYKSGEGPNAMERYTGGLDRYEPLFREDNAVNPFSGSPNMERYRFLLEESAKHETWVAIGVGVLAFSPEIKIDPLLLQ